MSKLLPPPRRDPPKYVDLNESEVEQLQLLHHGVPRRQVMVELICTGSPVSFLMAEYGLERDRRTVLLRSFRNV